MVDLPQIAIDTSIDRDYSMCFGCGKANPIGLKLKFQWDGKEGRAEFTPGESYQGWPGYVHGGILLCVLDEGFGYAAMFAGTHSVTARVQTRLRRMALVGEPLVVTCLVVKSTKRLVETEAKISLKDGTIIAEGASTQFVIGLKEDRSKSDA